LRILIIKGGAESAIVRASLGDAALPPMAPERGGAPRTYAHGAEIALIAHLASAMAAVRLPVSRRRSPLCLSQFHSSHRRRCQPRPIS
jgi:hypothetical protein